MTHRKLVLVCFLISCNSASKTPDVELHTQASEALAAPADKKDSDSLKAQPIAEAPQAADTVESLGKEIDVMERKLLSYIPPLTPKQEDEVDAIKAQIDAKESKRASMELQQMLGELKDEGEWVSPSESWD